MKKIFNYLFLGLVTAVSFTACKPLDKTYDSLGPSQTATPPVVQPPVVTATITLSNADYALLPASNYAQTLHTFNNATDATNSIPAILSAKYPSSADKSAVTVTYTLTPPAAVKEPDSLLTNIGYTLVNPDDYFVVLATNTTPSRINFSAANVLTYLAKSPRYANPVENQQAVLTFVYFEAGVANTVTQAFLYKNGAWGKIYLVSPAQYAAIGKGGTNNDFSSSDAANLPSYLNAFLKTDPAVVAVAKVGAVQYVSYAYFASSKIYQRIQPLIYNGTDWVASALTGTVLFTKAQGQWSSGQDNSVTYTLVKGDYTTIAGFDTGASQASKDNLNSFGNFSLTGATAWTDAQINAGIALLLKAKYTTATSGQKFIITYSAYNGSNTTVTKTFVYDGTKFNQQLDSATYTLVTEDYTQIGNIANIASAAAIDNLKQHGNFSVTGSTAWTDAQIATGIAAVLKTRYATATSGQVIAVTYSTYNGASVNVTKNFKFDGTNWTVQ